MIAAMGIGMAGVSMSTALVFAFAMGMVAGFAVALYMKKCISTPNDELDELLCGTEYSASEQQQIPEVTTVPPGPERTGGNSTPHKRKQLDPPEGCYFLEAEGRAIHFHPGCRHIPPDRRLCHRPLCKTCAWKFCVNVGSKEGLVKNKGGCTLYVE